MRDLQPIVYIIVLYLIVMSLGLFVSTKLIHKIYYETDEAKKIQPAVSNPDAPESSVQIFIYILVMTAILLLLIKFNVNFIIKIISILALFVGMLVTLASIFGDTGLILALLLLALALWKKQNLVILNLTLILTVSGVGAFLGASLSVLPAILLLIILSVYDLIAVFWTKHMVTLAEKAKGKLPFMFLIPYRDRNLGLGTGDIAIPLVFTVSVFKDYAMSNAVLTAAGGLVGVVSLFLYIQSKKQITLPALPPLTVGLIMGFAISLLPSLL